MFQALTGVCPETFESEPPPTDPPEDAPVYCSGLDGDFEFCFWDCPASMACGPICNSCDPVDSPM
jgi:hypothetical protein